MTPDARPLQGSPLHGSHLGRIAYRPALALQQKAWREVVDGTGPERLLTLEHEPVITLGRRAQPDHLRIPVEALAARGIDVVPTDRGGEATYHGPGQLVIYAIVHCRERGLGPSDIVHALADPLARWLNEQGVDAAWDKATPGLWVDGAKIAAVGMRIASGVSMHGAALNVTVALDAWQLFVPCGLPDRAAVRLQDHLDPLPDLETIAGTLRARIAAHLGSPLLDDAPPPRLDL